MSAQGTVLVFGATGRHGGTGAVVLDRLLQLGRPVRALVRGEDARAERLRGRGAEVVVGDVHDRRTLIPALDGVGAVYFAYPVAHGIVEAALNLASSVRELGSAPRVVAMSMAAADKDSPSGIGRAHALAEETLLWAGIDVTVLRIAAFFHENLLALHGAEIRETGIFANSYGPGAAPWISGEDSAELCVAALVNPQLYAGRTIVYPAGSELFSHREIAELLSRELGRDIRYEQITQRAWQRRLEALSGQAGLVNHAMAQHISTLGSRFAQSGQAPRFTPDPGALAAILGRAPMTVAEFVLRHRDEFGAFVPA